MFILGKITCSYILYAIFFIIFSIDIEQSFIPLSSYTIVLSCAHSAILRTSLNNLSVYTLVHNFPNADSAPLLTVSLTSSIAAVIKVYATSIPHSSSNLVITSLPICGVHKS